MSRGCTGGGARLAYRIEDSFGFGAQFHAYLAFPAKTDLWVSAFVTGGGAVTATYDILLLED